MRLGLDLRGHRGKRAIGLFIVALVLAGGVSVAQASPPSVSVKAGDVVYVDEHGAQRRLTSDGLNADAAISPDGGTIVYVRTDARGASTGDPDYSSLWRYDVAKGRVSRVVAPHTAEEIENQFTSIEKPVFSLDGGFVYVLSEAWATSSAVHQVNLATETTRFVIPGNSVAVIRSGPYRGFLLVNRHLYRGVGGSYNPTEVVRPDGKTVLTVPGTETDDSLAPVTAWLRRNGWTAW